MHLFQVELRGLCRDLKSQRQVFIFHFSKPIFERQQAAPP